MNSNEKLNHLSQKQIEEVVKKYMDKSIKIQDILDEYDIDVKPSKLLQLLPPVKTQEKCQICGEYLYKKIESRTSYSYNRDSLAGFCMKCGHKEYLKNTWGQKRCTCNGCLEIEKIKQEEKRRLINELYECEHEKYKFNELELSDQVKLLYLLFNNPSHNTCQITPPRELSKNWVAYINRLKDIKAISVSSKSDIAAFCVEDFPRRYYVSKVTYDINVLFDECDLKMINNNIYFSECSNIDELIMLLKEYIYDDLISKFEIMLEDRRLQLYISEEANNSFIDLIDKISYTQILELCYRVAVFFSDKVLVGDIKRFVANKAVLSNVSKFYNNAIEKNWTLKHAEIDYLEDELDFFIHRVLNKDISILKEVPSTELITDSGDREKDYNNTIGYATE